MISGEYILEIWYTKILWVIWIFGIILYIWGRIMWKLGKWKITFKPEDKSE